MGVFSRLFGDDNAHNILDYLESWDKRLSEGFNQGMHNRVCKNSVEIYAVMREACAILDQLICEETYSFTFTCAVRERLAGMLRAIDGTGAEDEQV